MFLCTSATQPGKHVGLASIELVVIFYLYGLEKENSRHRWPVGVHGTMLQIHTHASMHTNHRARFKRYKLHTIIFPD